MKAILKVCCGLDVHRDKIVACLMKGELEGKPRVEIKVFSALQHDLKRLKNWLEEEECYNVAMESTGVYWKAVYTTLEEDSNEKMEILAA